MFSPALLFSFLFVNIIPQIDANLEGQTFQPALSSSWIPERNRARVQLQTLVRTILLRRTKTSTIHGRPILQLPVKTTENVYVAFNEEEGRLCTALEDRTRLQFNRYLNGGSTSRNILYILTLL